MVQTGGGVIIAKIKHATLIQLLDRFGNRVAGCSDVAWEDVLQRPACTKEKVNGMDLRSSSAIGPLTRAIGCRFR